MPGSKRRKSLEADACPDEVIERGRPCLTPIDNKIDAPSAAIPGYLAPPLGSTASPTRTRSSSHVSHHSHNRSRSTSRGSSSTGLTPDSFHRHVARPGHKAPRKQLHCPVCGQNIKNSFNKHFLLHLRHLLQLPNGVEIPESYLMGCGYCPTVDLHSDDGNVFQGPSELASHVHEHHSQANRADPRLLSWDFNASFNNLLSGNPNIRRKFMEVMSKKAPNMSQSIALTWSSSSDTRGLLHQLQTLAGGLEDVFSPQANCDLENLLVDVYNAAAQKFPSSRQPPPLRILPPAPPPPHISSQTNPSLAHMGAGFDNQSQTPFLDITSTTNWETSASTQQSLQNAQQNYYVQGGLQLQVPPFQPLQNSQFLATASPVAASPAGPSSMSTGPQRFGHVGMGYATDMSMVEFNDYL